jgi:hypothetical protein
MEHFGSFSVWHWLIVLLLVLVVLMIPGLSGGRTGGALVVKKFFKSATPREDGVYVEIVGRQSGLIAWILALLKIDPTVEMRVKYTKVEYMSSNFSGFNRVVLPIESVASIFFGVSRPWIQALTWLFIFLAGAYVAAEAESTPAVLGLIISGVLLAVLIFVLNRQRAIGFTDVTGEDYRLVLKRSVIEGQEITEQSLDEISRIILALVDEHKKPRHS